jgi:hypothetical protein
LSILRYRRVSVILRHFIGMFRMNRVFPHPASPHDHERFCRNRAQSYSVGDGATSEKDSPACSGGEPGVVRGFIQMIRCLGLDKGKQALVFLGGSKELEGNASRTHRMDHRGQFKRRFTLIKRQLQIKDVVPMDLRFAGDDTTAHREIEHRSLTLNFSPRK